MGYGSRGITQARVRARAWRRRSAYLMNRQRDAVGLIGVRRPDRRRCCRRARVPGTCARCCVTLDRLAARQRDERVEAAAPARRRVDQARHGGPHLGSARRSGAGHPRPEAFAVPWHRRHRVPRARSRRGSVSVPSARRAFTDVESADVVTADPAHVRQDYLDTLTAAPRYSKELRGQDIDFLQSRHVAAARLCACSPYLDARARRKYRRCRFCALNPRRRRARRDSNAYLHLLRRDVAPQVPFTACICCDRPGRALRVATACAICCCRRARRSPPAVGRRPSPVPIAGAAATARQTVDRDRSLVQHRGGRRIARREELAGQDIEERRARRSHGAVVASTTC